MKNLIDRSSHDSQITKTTNHGQGKKRIDVRRLAAVIIALLTVLALAACSFTGYSDSDSDIIIIEKATLAESDETMEAGSAYDTAQSGLSVSESAGSGVQAQTGNAAQTQADALTQAQAEATTPAEVIATAETQNNGDFEIATEDGTVSVSGSTYTITSTGTYVVTGTLSDGQIIIDAGEEDEVELDLSGASITCSYDSPIYAKSAGKLKLKAVEGTVNVVIDARAAKVSENDTTGSAAVYAECDLNLAGKGTLAVTAGYNNGIQSKDDLQIKNLTLTVTAPNNALKGNDSVTIESGSVTAISTAGDGIKTDNSDVSSKGNQRGNVTISGGTVNIFSAQDGIDASYDVIISGDASIVINTHSYSSFTSAAAKKTATSNGVTKSADSSKGIKADDQVVILGGSVTIRCMDDGIHANGGIALENGSKSTGNVTISGGMVSIECADDGIHADGTLLIEGGYVDVVNSHEGLEGHNITVNDGEIHVYATDDGVNATSSSGSRGSDGLITVKGGLMIVEVGGRDVDGIDSNGNYVQTGGIVIVSNPNADSSGNTSAVDVDSSVSVTGGVIVALGTVPGGGNTGGGQGGNVRGGRFGIGGMSSGSSLPSGYVTYSSSLKAGTHTFSFGDVNVTFTLKSGVNGGWIWASGISAGSYTLK